LVLGHHPHVLQGVEEYRSGLIAYSLGNFIFDSWQSPTRKSAILSCTFAGGEITRYELVPISIDRRYRVKRVASPHSELEQLKLYSQHIASKSNLAALDEPQYASVAAQAYLTYRLECYAYFVRNFWRYHPRILFSSLFRSVLRRLKLA